MVRRLCCELLLKSLQIVNVNVRNSPVVEVRINPVQKLITLARYYLRSSGCVGRCRPDKEINEMFPSLVNQGRYRSVVQIVETAADQGKTCIRKIDNRRREIEFASSHGFTVCWSEEATSARWF